MRLQTDERDPLPPLSSGKKDANRNNLGLDIGVALAGRPWLVDPDIDREDWKFGLIRGEKYLLRSYALDIGLAQDDPRPFLRAIFG
jgi:hypothetical protein